MRYSLIIHFDIKKYELSLTIDISLLHMYHLSVLPPKQHTIPLTISRQISNANVSPNLTDAQMPCLARISRLVKHPVMHGCVCLKPQSHQACDQVTTYLRPKNGPIVERTYDWWQMSCDWWQRWWVIARGKSVATRS